MVEAAAGGVALGDVAAVFVGVDLDIRGGTLELGLVAHGPPDHGHRDGSIGEISEAEQPFHPFVVLGLEDTGDLGALGFGDGCGGVPADAVVDIPTEEEWKS